MPFLLISLVLVLLAAPATAGAAVQSADLISGAARELRSNPVYVHPDARDALPAEQADAVRQRIRARDAAPLRIAVLPAGAVGRNERDQALAALAERVRREGTYVLASENFMRTYSTETGLQREVGAAADQAIQLSGRDGLPAVLLDFVDRMGAVRAGEGVAAGTPQRGTDGGGSGGGGGGGFLLLAFLALIGGVFFISRRKRSRQDATAFAEARDNVRDDLVALGEDLRALDIDVELPNTPQAVKDDYAKALSAYEQAETIWERARRPDDLAPVGALLEEGRFAMAAAKARMEGHEPPERRPPCFFDPRHGPSTRDVEWAPPYGQPRLVPACEADAIRVESGEDPQAREVVVGGQRTPYWNAGPMYAPYAGGFFGGFGGGLLPGLLIGSSLGAMMAPGMAYGSGFGYDGGGWEDYGGGDFGGGDFGGGGFGGGDFGGGGFGGGDFGGGGFGGGDF